MSFGELAHAFVNTPGIGGIMVMSVITIALVIYFFVTRWVIQGDREKSETTPQRRRRIQ
ncbi:MAG: hypothetical protein ACE5FD_16890 [Anaerolineae bacterium]